MIDTSISAHYVGDTRTLLRELPDGCVRTCITSPPYWGLRSYLPDGHPLKAYEIGLEPTPALYLESLMQVFREVWRVLADDGTLWLNLGDSYVTKPRGPGGAASSTLTGTPDHARRKERWKATSEAPNRRRQRGLKNKDLVGIPWMVAFALRDAGWYLRCDIVWCISGGAWVWARTQKGDMPVMVKDLTRLDPTTVQLWTGERWTRVLGWGPSDETGGVELVLRSGERIGCTGAHLWPTQRGHVKASDLRVGDVIETCELPEPTDATKPGYMTEDVAWLIGLWMAEGSRSDYTMQLSLNADEEEWVPRIRKAVAHLGGTLSYDIAGNQLAVRMWGGVLSAVLDTYRGGHTSENIHFTNATWQLPNHVLRAIANGYLAGDGHYDSLNDRWVLGFTRNYSLERDLRIMAARLGATIAITLSTATCQTGEFPSFRGEWRWKRSGHGNECDRGEIIDIHGSRARQFWDISVEDESHLYALASGVLTHNCKPNPMPESVTDRPTKAHEYIFLLAKSERYYYDIDAIREPQITKDERHEGKSGYRNGHPSKDGVTKRALHPLGKNRQTVWTGDAQTGFAGGRHATNDGLVLEVTPEAGAPRRRSGNKSRRLADGAEGDRLADHLGRGVPWQDEDGRRNKRSVWTVTTQPYPDAHFATFPPALIEPCVLAGSAAGDLVLDPFFGSGTVGQVAEKHMRRWIGFDINDAYEQLAKERTAQRTLRML